MKILIGNIFESKAETLVNTVNCVGVMGKGVALEFKRKYPDMYKDYVNRCNTSSVKPGEPYYYQDLFGTSVINFPTKDHWRSPSKLSYIVNGLRWFVANYKELNIKSIAFPPLGCGNGGLTWDLVGPLMYHYLSKLPIDIEIYAPYGTKKEKLTVEFLENNMIRNSGEVLGAKSIKFNPKWLLILETIKRINQKKYVLSVGRTMIQKISYILTLEGVDTGFVFTRGTYGPYCADVKSAQVAFSNANLITESPIGQMIRVNVTKNYEALNPVYDSKDIKAVERTVDLFSRIKNTAQAELFTTIIFAHNQLCKEQDLVTEQSIYDYVIRWKPRWKDNIAQNEALVNAIRNLALLQWISPESTHGLIKEFEDL